MADGTPAAPARLVATGLSKRYGAVQALADVDFDLQPGEVVALLGENGAGKSTLVKVLSGLVTPDTGTITMDGEAVNISSSARSQAAGIAVVQQEYSTVGALSVAENLVLGKANSPFLWTRGRLRSEAQALLGEVGLGHIDPSTKVEELSVAEMQLLEVARVLAREARVVIFDEPTAALSDAETEKVLAVVRGLAAKGISIVYVTHRLPEVFAIADRVSIFRNGRSLPSVAIGDIDVAGIIQMMLGRTLETMYPERKPVAGDERLVLREVVISGLSAPVSLSARRGEILGLTGQLGSGADLVVKALASETPILGGVVEVDGSPLKAKDRSKGLADGITYCSPDRKRSGIFAGLSIVRNLSSSWLSSVATAGTVSTRRERTAAEALASAFAIDSKRLGSSVGKLSGGNQQKVALAKWLGNNPTLFLVEEPTRGVDVGARSDIYAKLRGLCEQGMTVVVSSSDTNEIHGLCDTIATFYHGEMVGVGPADDWTEDALVAAVMNRSEK
ncbi:sugar ABC transporter ATP-binding protein [Herbiconiux sp. KACC 21604]|uniref:sugar ABC transporter ATP-binding protein n=1 Tax=unclassified Herbiconiux TaxID=2618217 RepID=UPI001492D910|nr:sugar ABC transporter ATP-binding protein [Herbiconiux sp. SALV-R1]QJU54944.1 sugar ABC transporter ATP-binding protein [Herbiconiux sp. SALV-R1]WPO86069.1 sugar ABC transporter ATP-binding protein [Herbiconiux sp. KACC 21604]